MTCHSTGLNWYIRFFPNHLTPLATSAKLNISLPTRFSSKILLLKYLFTLDRSTNSNIQTMCGYHPLSSKNISVLAACWYRFYCHPQRYCLLNSLLPRRAIYFRITKSSLNEFTFSDRDDVVEIAMPQQRLAFISIFLMFADIFEFLNEFRYNGL